MLFYATSNRKHFLKTEENSENFLINKERMRENLSLADRFGLCISFYEMDFSEYISFCDELFEAQSWDEDRRENMHKLASTFSDSKGLRSPRAAQQFFAMYGGQL